MGSTYRISSPHSELNVGPIVPRGGNVIGADPHYTRPNPRGAWLGCWRWVQRLGVRYNSIRVGRNGRRQVDAYRARDVHGAVVEGIAAVHVQIVGAGVQHRCL
eukprot:scaffold7450_cov76-Phaeocystis_antarctica.AAC.2